MRTFVQTQHQPQKPVPPNHVRSHTATPGLHLRANPILRLHRTSANPAVEGMSQTRADECNTGLSGKASPYFGHDFSRIPIRPLTRGTIQTKLTANTPGDEYEREADRTAEQVLRMPEPKSQRACTCGGACPTCQTKQPEHAHEHVQTKRVGAVDGEQTEVPPIVHDVLGAPGQPIDLSTRAFMERRLGHDFSRVRVHADEKAADSARAVQARAYTLGEHVVFGSGEYQPASEAGRRLLAHELTHVVQQAGSEAGAAPVLQRQQPPAAAQPPPCRATKAPAFSASGSKLFEIDTEKGPCYACPSSLPEACPRMYPPGAGPVQFSWQAKFFVWHREDGAFGLGGGKKTYVIQKMEKVFNFNPAVPNYQFTPLYWEAFEIGAGGETKRDHWQFELPDHTAGDWELKGTLYLTDSLPDGMAVGNVPDAGSLPSTINKPKGLGRVRGSRHAWGKFDFTDPANNWHEQ